MSDARRFEPLPWQLAPWKDTSPTLLLAGGAGSGKSVMALHKLNALMLRFPGALGLLLRKSRQSLRNSSLPQFEQLVGPQVRHLKSEFRFEYPNGSRVVYGGMFDAKQREAIRSVAGERGSGADFALLEEANAFTEADYEEVGGRMRGTAAGWTQIILCTNPDTETHWINQRFVRPHLAGKPLRAGVYLPRPEDNPLLPPEYLERLRALTGVRRARLYEGRWVRAEGTVFESWNPEIHLIDAFPIPKDWRRIRCMDFGYVNPRVVLWLAEDTEGHAYVYREIYRTKYRASECAKEVRWRSNGERIEGTVCDHDADERADFEAEGIETIAAKKDVTTGIQVVENRLKVREDTGKPGLMIMRGCLVEEDPELRKVYKPWCTAQEFDGYIWQPNPDGSITKEAPKKENDHGMDTLRYGLVYLDRDMIDPAGVSKEALENEMHAAQRLLALPQSSSQAMGFGGGKVRGSRWL